MRHPTPALRKIFWMACACVLLLPRFAAADTPRIVDFDGDGRHDRYTLDGGAAPVLSVWFSASDTTQFIRSRHPLLQVIAVDLDGDHQPELVARDAKSHIHVWTRKQERFRSVHPRKAIHLALRERHQHGIEDNDDDRPGVIATPFASLALLLSPSPRAPGSNLSTARMLRPAPACPSIAAVAPFAPRPPPSPLSR